MNWSQLIDAVAQRAGVPKSTVKSVLDAAIAETLERVGDGDTVTWWQLGSFSKRLRKGRTQRNVANGRRMFVGDTFLARFRPAQAFRTVIQTEESLAWKSEDYQRAWRLAVTMLGDLAIYHPAAKPIVAGSAGDDEVAEACRSAFGPAWQQAKTAYGTKVGAEHQAVLLECARRKWGSAE